MALESAAVEFDPPCTDPLFRRTLTPTGAVQLDPSPLVRELLARRDAGVPAGELAAQFHDQLAGAWAEVTIEASERLGVRTVGLSGGCLCNRRLSDHLVRRLESAGLRVLRHREVPPNDGGIALGQAAVAAARLAAPGPVDHQRKAGA
jgi:hydrogenase maturation protein HypF